MDRFTSLKSKMKAQYEEKLNEVRAKLKNEEESSSEEEQTENVSPPRKGTVVQKNSGSFIGGSGEAQATE